MIELKLEVDLSFTFTFRYIYIDSLFGILERLHLMLYDVFDVIRRRMNGHVVMKSW